MEFTGESHCPQIAGEIACEHYLRNVVAVGLAEGRDMLDCAGGEGYGSALLARTARSVKCGGGCGGSCILPFML